MYDVIVVGAGPAGMTAALYAARAGKSVVVLEGSGFGGQIAVSPRVENYPCVPLTSGAELTGQLMDQLAGLDVELELDRVARVQPIEGGFLVHSDDGRRACKSVVLAPGAFHRTLGLPEEDALSGVSYCAVCDGAFYKGGRVAVVGGGDTALQDALFLSSLCAHVTLIHRRTALRGGKRLADQLLARPNVDFLPDTVVTALEGREGALRALALLNRASGTASRLPVDGLFVAVGQSPGTAPFADLARVDAQGYFQAGEDCATDTPGLFVAGDCRAKSVRQLATAVSDGAVAGLAASAWADGHS